MQTARRDSECQLPESADTVSRHLSGKMRLSTLAVHPAYWRRGHAMKLVSFCTQLADLYVISMYELYVRQTLTSYMYL